MLPYQVDNILLSRRNFILASLMYLFIDRKSVIAPLQTESGTHNKEADSEFLILGGWVLRKDDVFESLS